jgi:hypothetical protein
MKNNISISIKPSISSQYVTKCSTLLYLSEIIDKMGAIISSAIIMKYKGCDFNNTIVLSLIMDQYPT